MVGASIIRSVKRQNTHAARTAAVVMTSLRLSAAVASSVSEPIAFPSDRLNAIIHSFTPMESSSTATSAGENEMGCGCKMRSNDDRASSAPMTKISAATARPEMYSMRAWPYGWSRSAGFSASLKPSSVTTELDASDRLFTASAEMEMLPESVPTMSFAMHKSTLHAMPTAPASLPQRARAAGSDGSRPRRNVRSSSAVMATPPFAVSAYYRTAAAGMQGDFLDGNGLKYQINDRQM